MTKPKTKVDLWRSLDADWPLREPITEDLVVEVRGYNASDPNARRMFVNACWLTPDARTAPAC